METKKIASLLTALLCSATLLAQEWPTPTLEARPGARWWWLGSAVDKNGIEKNMRQYAAAGIGALEITPIYGVKGNEANEISFLSPRWMQTLRMVEQEGQRDSILIDMNTGTGWPFGGPNVPLDEAACKVLIVRKTATAKECRHLDIGISDEREKPFAKLSRVMAYGDGWVKDVTQYAANGILAWKSSGKDSIRIYAVYDSRTRQKVKRAAPGGEGYVIDHFDATAVKHYLARFDSAFASPQYAQDQPNASPSTPRTPLKINSFFNDSYEVYGANWTPSLFVEFEKRRGYKLEEHLPELLGECDNTATATNVLIDYRETLSDLLLENFTNQWADWAHSHGTTVRNQAHGSPANLIDIYAAVDIPEIEGFGLTDFHLKGLRTDSGFTRKNDSDVSMLKYASSAAHVAGKPLTSSETFTWLTEHFRTSLSQMKPDLDLMFTCGVNHMFFHGTCYSPPDDAWPGWKFYASVDMSPTNSIWRDAPFLMDYITRCQSFLQMGKPDNDFLVMLPVRDMWAERAETGERGLLMQFDIHSMAKRAPDFIRTILEIDSMGFDCDYISERLLLSTRYRDGMLETAAGTRYKALIIPGTGRMAESVRRHIESLKSQGAKVIGANEQQMKQAATPEEMKCLHRLRCIRRTNATGHHYFIANLTPDDIRCQTTLAVPFKSATWFNPMTGETRAARIDGNRLELSLRSGESMILQTYDDGAGIAQAERPLQTDFETIPLSGEWQLSFDSSAPRVKRTFSLPRLQTWETLDDDSARVTMGTGVYTTKVRLTKKQSKKHWTIELGDVRESARVFVNGRFIGCAWAVPFVLDCKDALKSGENEIRIEVTNLPANRIADMDRRGVEWRKFKEINVVDINYKKTLYSSWKPVPSGLAGPVTLVEAQ